MGSSCMTNWMHFILSDDGKTYHQQADRHRPRYGRHPTNVTAPSLGFRAASTAFSRAKRYSEHTYLATERRGGRPDTCRSAWRTTERHDASARGQIEAVGPRPECGALNGAHRPCDGTPWWRATCWRIAERQCEREHCNGVGGCSALYSRRRRRVPGRSS